MSRKIIAGQLLRVIIRLLVGHDARLCFLIASRTADADSDTCGDVAIDSKLIEHSTAQPWPETDLQRRFVAGTPSPHASWVPRSLLSSEHDRTGGLQGAMIETASMVLDYAHCTVSEE